MKWMKEAKACEKRNIIESNKWTWEMFEWKLWLATKSNKAQLWSNETTVGERQYLVKRDSATLCKDCLRDNWWVCSLFYIKSNHQPYNPLLNLSLNSKCFLSLLSQNNFASSFKIDLKNFHSNNPHNIL